MATLLPIDKLIGKLYHLEIFFMEQSDSCDDNSVGSQCISAEKRKVSFRIADNSISGGIYDSGHDDLYPDGARGFQPVRFHRVSAGHWHCCGAVCLVFAACLQDAQRGRAAADEQGSRSDWARVMASA